MRIQQWTPGDDAVTRGCYDVMFAAHRADDPVEPPPSYRGFDLYLRTGWEEVPGEVWYSTAGDGSVTGFYRIGFPDLENRDKAHGGPTVHPAARRRGTGRELLRHAGTRAEAHGRALFGAQTTAGTSGDDFARAVGARLDQEEVRRIQYLAEIAPGTVQALRAEAEKAAAGYSLASWAGLMPEKYYEPMAQILNAYNDAPHGENEEPEDWTADRVRERTGQGIRSGVMRGYGVVALRDSDGEMAAYTGVLVDHEVPEWGHQQLTAVTRAHRGHRLGLLVKTAMLELLAKAEPRLTCIETGNAAGNEHMIAINDKLGYRVVEPSYNWWEMPVGAMR
jgi:RimJ/RimL family protein N-acetyltransferase